MLSLFIIYFVVRERLENKTITARYTNFIFPTDSAEDKTSYLKNEIKKEPKIM